MRITRRTYACLLGAGLLMAACGDNSPSDDSWLCTDETDCEPGYACLHGVCVEGTACTASTDCPDGSVCFFGVCADDVDCGSDGDCEPGEVCAVDGTCVATSDPNGCTDSTECPNGEICVDEVCVDIECFDREDCDPGEICDGGVCVDPTACGDDGDCAPTEVCENDHCVPRCETRDDCLSTGAHALCRADGHCALMPATPCGAADCYVWYVSESSTAADPDGLSWATAFPMVQSAMAMAWEGEEVWVAEGTYAATQLNDTVLVMVDGVNVRGGFEGTEATLGDRPPLAWPYLTILEGDRLGDDPASTSDNSFHVATGASNATLEGFTLRGGFAYGTSSNEVRGGAIYVDDATGFAVSRCAIVGSAAQRAGGGIYVSESGVTLTDVLLEGNTTGWSGGGLSAAGGSHVVFDQVSVRHNSAVNVGGGLNALQDTLVVVTNSAFLGNDAYRGGAMHLNDARALGVNALFADNRATDHGGAVMNLASSPVFTNCSFVGNSAVTDGGAFFNRRGTFDIPSQVVVTNGLFFANTSGTGVADVHDLTSGGDTSSANVTFSCIDGFAPDGGTAIDGVLRAASGEVFLAPSSSCANVGSDAAANDAQTGYPVTGLHWYDLTTRLDGSVLDLDTTAGDGGNDVDLGTHYDPTGVWIETFVTGADAGGTRLTWATHAATTCTMDQGVGPVPANGTTGVVVSPAVTADYTLTCAGIHGPARATVTVTP